jgi:DNA-binding SARP family transcriptional activator/tetratricopeptide (TPR) repeat protein
LHGSQRTTVQLCGQLVVELGGHHVESKLPGRLGMLFAYLAARRDRAVRRDELIDALWPSAAPASPDAALRTLLSRLRRALAADVIQGRAELVLALPADAWIDLEAAIDAIGRAEAALARADWDAAWEAARLALDISRRGFMSGYDAPWIDERRREVEELMDDALECVARAGLGSGGSRGAAAERAARTLRARAPYKESGYQVLMELLAAEGNVAEALQVYDALRVLLRDELGTIPSPAITALHERLLTEGAARPAAARPPPEPGEGIEPPTAWTKLPLQPWLASRRRDAFVGREAELDTLNDAFDRARSGQLQVVLLDGEPGVGKTRLAAELAARVHEEGAAVLYGRSDEETLIAYQPFVEALRHYVSSSPLDRLRPLARNGGPELGALVPELRERLPDLAQPVRDDAASQRYRLFEAVVGILHDIAISAPLLLVLDDLHWADKPTLHLLRHIARLTDPPLMILAVHRLAETQREQEVLAALGELRREHPLERLSLGGLDERAVGALVSARLGEDVAPAFTRALRDHTEGNPFFIEELLRHVEERGGDPRRAGLPQGIKALMGRRIARLSDAAHGVLAVAAVVGREFSLDLVERVSGLSDEPLLDAIEEAVGADVISEVPGSLDRYGFSHTLIREALYEELSASRRVRLHWRIGRAIEEMAGDDPGSQVCDLAYHFGEAAGVGEGARALDYAARAGAWATSHFAHEEAVDYFSQALDTFESEHVEDADRHASLLLSLGDAFWKAGDHAQGREAFRRAGDVAKEVGEPERLARAALGFGGTYVEAGVVDQPLIELLEDALAELDQADSGLRACLLARLAEALYFAPDRTRSPALSAEAVEMARRSDDRAALAVALNARRLAIWGPDDLEERMAVTEELLSLVSGLDRRELSIGGLAVRGLLSQGLELAAHHWRLLDLLEVGDGDGADREGDELVRLSAELRSPFYRRFAAHWRTVRAQLDGRLDETERLAEEALAIARGAEDGSALQFYAAQIAFVRAEQGRSAELVDTVAEVAQQNPAMPVWRAALTTIRCEAGFETEARRELDQLARDGFAAFPRDVFWLTAMTHLADTAASLDDAACAGELYELLAPYRDRNVLAGDALCWGPVSHYLGLLATTLRRWDAAAAHFEDALAMSARLRARGSLAHIRQAYGAMLLERGRPGDAQRGRELIGEALATAQELGMGRLIRIASRDQPETVR